MKQRTRIKLRTKITLIAAAVILLAAVVSDAVIWMICRRTMLHEAEQTVLSSMLSVYADYLAFLTDSDGGLRDTEQRYFFKQRGDDYVICLRGNTEIFNQTILTPDDLNKLEMHEFEQQPSVLHCETEIGGHHLLIARSMESSNFALFTVYDLADVTRRLRLLALGMLGVLLGVCIPAVTVLYLLTRRTLRPLGMLSERAKQIASGAYDKRADVTGTDEIGMLAADFNTMADAVQEKIRALAESEERKTMFMADFSHELKTPLTAISGYAQTMRTVKLSADDQAEALGYIYSESKRLDRLAKKMMRLMELDRTEQLQTEDIDLSALISAACDTCRPVASEKQITLETGKCEGSLRGDFDLLHDAVCNLIDNACKASQAGQTVKLYTEMTPRGPEIPDAISLSSDCAIVVEDEGCGIPAEEIRNLTEPFYMVDKSRSRRSGGAGLGLSLAAQIFRLHGIRMDIESEVGRGTKVKLHFVYTALNT